ncbi:Cupin 2 conserved barrel domain protein [Rhodothermus marinus SG0.5JP17-172]|uniref:5-deoxy-glucuronate isomerase n=1 Tax=Rhodothermus marinus TaxID=29549 RepID=UPI000223DC15|nr:5-deoxy-glucuronate isomerase [Rhodothermus marinus]AEN74196.1 Cupin 2 conserved barrel domain protein [Rhodothermus marinus SG0.5JP17-172]
MVPPRDIGPFVTTEPKTPAQRRLTGRAIMPGEEAPRTVELFDARPALNRREEVITGANSSFRFLRFARIALQPDAPGYAPIPVQLGDTEEAVFYVNRGQARLSVDGQTYRLGKGDVLYVGLGRRVVVEADGPLADVSEFRAIECHTEYPVQLVRHRDIEGTELAADLGRKRPMTRRTVYKLVDQNVQACRLLFGDTYLAQPGGVGSYPPHFHGPDGPFGLGDRAKEEIYHFRCESEIPGDTPFVLQNCARPEDPVSTYVHIFDEQAINVTPGYHDTIAPPPVHFMFTWCLGAYTEGHRDWSEIYNRPGYEDEW